MNAITAISLVFFAALALALCLAFAARRIRRSRPVAVGVFLLGSVLAALHADKPTPVPSALLRWDRGLADNGSIATNDTVFIRGTYDPLMANDALHVDYRDRTITDSPDGWARAYDGAVGDLADGFTVTIPDATNMVVWIWSEYVEPAPTHTNGEYRIIYVGRIDGGAADAPRYVTPRTPIKGDARCSARDYVQDGLIAMWDGIENAGWGVHGANAPIDLVGSADLTSVGNTIIEADNFTAGVGTYFKASVPTFATAVKNKNFTLQIIVKNSRVSNSAICGIGNRGVWLYGSSSYNVSALNILTSSYAQTPRINFYSDAKFSISILGGAVPKIRLNDSEVQAIYGFQTNVSPTDLLLGALNASFTGGSASFYSVRAYSRILTSEEIQHNYKIDSIRFGLPGAPSAVVPLSPPSLPPPAQSLFSTLATENLTE